MSNLDREFRVEHQSDRQRFRCGELRFTLRHGLLHTHETQAVVKADRYTTEK